MPSTKRSMNWRSVTFTPTAGSATTFTGVTTIAVNPNANIAKFSGDGDRFVTTLLNDFSDPSITVTTADIGAAVANGVGTIGSFGATLKGTNNQTSTGGAGDISFTLANAIVADIPISGAHRQFGTANVTFNSYSSDGVTSPLSFSIS